jgi:hypothetical protein
MPLFETFSPTTARHPDEANSSQLKRHGPLERDLFFTEPPSMEEILARLQTLEFIKTENPLLDSKC